MAIATQVNSPTFKDIITVVIKWVAGLVGPISIPFLLGMLPTFRKCGPTAALTSWAAGLFAFWLTNYGLSEVQLQIQIVSPVATSLVLFILIGLLRPEATPERDALLARINSGEDDDGSRGRAADPGAGGRGGAGCRPRWRRGRRDGRDAEAPLSPVRGPRLGGFLHRAGRVRRRARSGGRHARG